MDGFCVDLVVFFLLSFCLSSWSADVHGANFRCFQKSMLRLVGNNGKFFHMTNLLALARSTVHDHAMRHIVLGANSAKQINTNPINHIARLCALYANSSRNTQQQMKAQGKKQRLLGRANRPPLTPCGTAWNTKRVANQQFYEQRHLAVS